MLVPALGERHICPKVLIDEGEVPVTDHVAGAAGVDEMNAMELHRSDGLDQG